MQGSERVKLVCKKRLHKCIHLTLLTTEIKQTQTPKILIHILQNTQYILILWCNFADVTNSDVISGRCNFTLFKSLLMLICSLVVPLTKHPVVVYSQIMWLSQWQQGINDTKAWILELINASVLTKVRCLGNISFTEQINNCQSNLFGTCVRKLIKHFYAYTGRQNL